MFPDIAYPSNQKPNVPANISMYFYTNITFCSDKTSMYNVTIMYVIDKQIAMHYAWAVIPIQRDIFHVSTLSCLFQYISCVEQSVSETDREKCTHIKDVRFRFSQRLQCLCQ